MDCGITLAGHVAGHGTNYNTVTNNVANGNGAAGILMATAVPGDSVSHNVVSDNSVSGNGYSGILLHTHAPNNTVNANVITDNTVGTNSNLIDLGATVGITVMSAGSPITNTVIIGNTISHNYYGIFVDPWLTTGTVMSQNKFVGNIYKDPNWITYHAFVGGFASPASLPSGSLGPAWKGAEADAAVLLKAKVKTDAQYVKLVHSKQGAFGKSEIPLQHAAENLYNQYHVYR